jgi:ubiquinone/menaquinone biosynthesis C-methylase UbiE
MEKFQEKSFESQKINVEKILQNSKNDEFVFAFKNKDCFLYNIRQRTLNGALKPFLINKNNWLTVGDYNGVEANFLIENGQNITASDLSDAVLTEVSKQKYISAYKAINVENITFDDNSFDYVFCKEAFHHFPRPYIGLYEMLRVADKAVILLEPIDILAKMPVLLFIKNVLDRINPNLINKIWKNRYSFESVGNYVYKVSEREIEKIAMGINLPCIAFKSMNVFFSHKQLPESTEVPMNKKLWNKVIRKLKFLDILSFFTLIPPNSLSCVIFKQMPDSELLNGMKKDGYKIIQLPKNPYLS